MLGLTLVGTAIWLMSIIGVQTGILNAGAATRGASHWIAFDEAAIPGYVADDKVVFVDVTADWCITCQANKKLVIDREPVAGAPGRRMTSSRCRRIGPIPTRGSPTFSAGTAAMASRSTSSTARARRPASCCRNC